MKIIEFFKKSFAEVRYKVSWPSYKELQKFLFGFFIAVVIWTFFLFGVDELNKKLQKVVYAWISQKS